MLGAIVPMSVMEGADEGPTTVSPPNVEIVTGATAKPSPDRISAGVPVGDVAIHSRYEPCATGLRYTLV